MADLVLHLTAQLQERLQARATAEGKPADQVAQDILARGLTISKKDSRAAPKQLRERRAHLIKELKEQGDLVSLPEALNDLILPDVDRNEVIESLSRAGGTPLSEIIIEQRGSKDWQITSSTPTRSSKSTRTKKVRPGHGHSSTARKTRSG